MAQAKRDQNRVPTLIAVSDVDSLTPIVIEGDATTAGLNVNIVSDDVGVGGGTEYITNAVAPDPATGKTIVMERDDILSTLTPVEGDWVRVRGTAEGALWTQDFNSDTMTTHLSEIEGAVETIEGAVVGGQMQVDIVADGAGLATSTNQLADGHNVTIDNLSSNEVYVRGSGTAGSADAAVLSIQGIASMTPVATTESSPISGFATSAKQLADDHNVTVSNTALVGDGNPTIDSITQVAINLNAGANQVLVASAGSKQIWVYAVAYTCSVAGTVSFQDESDIAITGIMDHAANSGLAVGPSGNFAMPIWKLGTDKDLEVDIVTAALDGWITYAIVSV